MSLLLYQELELKDYNALLELENITRGELKVIRFMKNIRGDRIITDEERVLLIDWENGNRIEEELE